MRRFTFQAVMLCLAGLLMIVAGCSDQDGSPGPAGLDPQLASKGVPNPNPGQDPEALPMNLSFPIIFTSTGKDIAIRMKDN